MSDPHATPSAPSGSVGSVGSGGPVASVVDRPQEIGAVLNRLRTAFRRLLMLHGTGRLLMLAAGSALLLFCLDYVLVLPAAVRVLLLLASLTALGTSAWRWLFRPVSRPLPDIELAHRIEASHPELRDKLLAAVAFTTGGGVDPRESGSLVQRTIADAQSAIATVDPKRAAPSGRAVRFAAAGAGAVALLAVLGGLDPTLTGIWLQRAYGADVSWPQRTHLTMVLPESRDTVVARGSSLTVKVVAGGDYIPSRAVLHIDYGGNVGTTEVRLARETDGSFTHEFVSIGGPFDFFVTAGDGRTALYKVHARISPEIERLQAWLTHPPYTRLEDTPIDAPLPDGNVRAPVGTAVKLQGRTNKEVREGFLVIAGDLTKPLAVSADGRTVSADLQLVENAQYIVRLVDREGLEGNSPFRYRLRAVPDRSPGIRSVYPASDRSVTPVAELPLACDVNDDYGIASVRAVYGLLVAGSGTGPTQTIDAPVSAEADGFGRQAEQAVMKLDLATLTVREAEGEPTRPLKIGDRLRLWFEATDFRPGDPNRSRSREFTIAIEAPETLERLLGEELARIRDLVKVTRVEQENALRDTEQLGAERNVSAESDVVRKQRHVGRRATNLRTLFLRATETAEINRLGDPTYRAGLTEMAETSRVIAEDTAPRASQQLEAARRAEGIERRRRLAAAREAQAKTDGMLADLLNRLERWEELADVIWGLRRIYDKEERLSKRVAEHHKEKIKDK